MADVLAEDNTNKRRILYRVIAKWKETPCLWDRSHKHYSNKKQRNVALGPLLKLYKLYKPDASIYDLRRALDNMRSSYRRTLRKITAAEARDTEYEPILWYFNSLKFLGTIGQNPVRQRRILHIHGVKDEDDNEEQMEEVYYLKSDSHSSSLEPENESANYLYLNETDTEYEKQYDLNIVTEFENGREPKTSKKIETASAESFGRTVGSQLGDLQPLQRYIAERLISEVIFQARFDKLTPESSISNAG